ncbi:hypothetical protein [Microbacterium rhizophilus]
MTSHAPQQDAHPADTAADAQAAPAPLPLVALGEPDAAICVDGVCRLPGT